MKKLPFELQFFGPAPSTTSIEGEFIYGQSNINAIEVSFELKGELDHYLFEREFKSHDRKDGLWQKSCFEFFIKKWNSSEYIEVNLSPNGEWQSYSFTDYRKDRSLFMGLDLSHFSLVDLEDGFKLTSRFSIQKDPFWDWGKYNLGLSVVLLQKSLKPAYLALLHMGDEPDFHHPDSFTLYF